jgi:cobyrinic acid a,c-diamide synthase
MAGTLAAVVAGCANFEPKLKVAGVIANFVSSGSHGRLLAEALKSKGLPPLLGCLPKNSDWTLPERHLGLVPENETLNSDAWYDSLADGVEKGVDLNALLAAAQCAIPKEHIKTVAKTKTAKLAVAMDDAFHFYYRDNLDALEDKGIELAFFSPLKDSSIPDGAKGIYIGGGYPELFAKGLSDNVAMRNSIRDFAESGRPLYAECGGLMYLCRSLQDTQGIPHAMCGIFPHDVKMGKRLHRLGYRETRTLKASPLGPAGTCYRGHEFHWSRIEAPLAAFDAAESKGVSERAAWEHSALSFKNVYASYVHAHFAYDDAVLSGIAASLS